MSQFEFSSILKMMVKFFCGPKKMMSCKVTPKETHITLWIIITQKIKKVKGDKNIYIYIVHILKYRERSIIT